MSGLRLKTADREHRCDDCGRLIPVGHMFLRKLDDKKKVDIRKHSNCGLYREAEVLHPEFNKDRSKRKP